MNAPIMQSAFGQMIVQRLFPTLRALDMRVQIDGCIRDGYGTCPVSAVLGSTGPNATRAAERYLRRTLSAAEIIDIMKLMWAADDKSAPAVRDIRSYIVFCLNPVYT